MKKVIVKFVLLYFFLINFCYADLLKPSSKLKPIDVLTIQLNSLKRNDTPYKDAGIEQTWEFAHPVNKLTTGPLERFKKMIYSKNYEILLNHENFKITVLNKTEMNSVFKVLILSQDKKKYNYIWQIKRVISEGKLKNCWMTTNVSSPEFLGETI